MEKNQKKRTALAILAAGIGSRYGGGIKQLEAVGPAGEIIMDYSIYDAIEAGFDKIVFIIRRDIEKDFREVIGKRIERVCEKAGVEIAYAYQSLQDIPAGQQVPQGRVKPWGTGQAVLCCKEVIEEPFAVINADDYYGKEAFRKLQAFLQTMSKEEPYRFCMAGFVLKNTLSEYGSVTRGICQVDARGFLTDVKETKNIVKTKAGASADGRVLNPDCYVSMNMWGLTPEFIALLERGFQEFFQKMEGDLQTAEFLLPTYIGQLLEDGRVTVEMLTTGDKWFGFTYREDKPLVVEAFRRLTQEGVYRADLFGAM